MLSPAAAKRWSQQQAGAGGGMGLARAGHKTNGNNLYVWWALVAGVPDRSLLGSLLHLRLPLGFGLQVPALPFLEATLLVLCLRLRSQKECKAAASVYCKCVQEGSASQKCEGKAALCPTHNMTASVPCTKQETSAKSNIKQHPPVRSTTSAKPCQH